MKIKIQMFYHQLLLSQKAEKYNQLMVTCTSMFNSGFLIFFLAKTVKESMAIIFIFKVDTGAKFSRRQKWNATGPQLTVHM
jgi:hypothetical protein